MRQCVIAMVALVCAEMCQAQEVNLGLDFQTNAIVQLERAFDGTVWGLSSSSVDRMPTLAGVHAIMSTDCGATWGSTVVTENIWRWGVDICPITEKVVWVLVNREDTNELYTTRDGGRMWRVVQPKEVQLDRVMGVHFFSPMVGVVIGQGGRRIENRWYASRTTDGGATWQRSVPMIVDPASEHIGERNDRSMTSYEGVCWIGMSSGRILVTQDTGRTWRMDRTSMAGGITGIAILSTGRLAVFGRDRSNTPLALHTSNGKDWMPLVVPAEVGTVHGIRTTSDGSLVTIPDPRTATGLFVLDAATLEKRGGLATQKECYSVLRCHNGSWLLGTELLPGGGMVKIDSRR